MAERRNARRSSRGGGDSVTVQDLAEAAGVSVASVSRALNNSAKVSDDVRGRVRDAANRLGYVPHAAARALASQSTHTIGAVVPTLENPNFAIGVEALQKRLTQAGYTLFVASCGYDMDQERQQVETLVTRGVDGIMLVGALHSPGLHAFLRGRNIPFVDTWVMSGDPRVPSVGFDNMAAAVQMTDFLLDLGHKNFGVIAGVTKSNDRAIARVKGIRKALKARGLPLKQERLIERPYRIVDGQLAMRALMTEKNRPTAVICGNDVLAFGAMLECQRLGIKIPGDVSIVGFDDLDFASQLVPPLTTINVPADKIGDAAADYLLAAVENRPNLLAPQILVNLIVRGSTSPPPDRRTLILQSINVTEHPPMSGPEKMSGVLSPVVTPFKADLSVDAERLVRQCRWLLSQNCGLAVFGTNSEANSLSAEEKIDLLDALIDAGLDTSRMMPGTGACAIPDTVRMTSHAVKRGCSGVLMLPPFYYKGVSDEGLFRAYSEVIQRVGDANLKIYLYHFPAVSQVPISLDLIERLLKEYPDTVVGIKDSSGDWNNMEAMLNRFPSFAMFPGNETLLLKSMQNGGAGCISATANINPGAIADLAASWQSPDAQAKQNKMNGLREMMQQFPMIPALKATVAHYSGDADWGNVRPPLVELGAEQEAAMLAELDKRGFAMPGLAEAQAA